MGEGFAKRQRALWLGIVLLLLLPLLVLVSTAYSETGRYGLLSAARVVLAETGIAEPHPEHAILKLRLLRALCALGVGGTLALAGAMTQGLFRNPLAEPGLLGIGSGASLGAAAAIAMLGGHGPDIWSRQQFGESSGWNGLLAIGLVPVLAFVGAMAAALTIYRIATRHGRISVPALLLTGLGINALLGALMAAMQALMMHDWQLAQAIIAWGFGSLDNRMGFHLAVVWSGALVALAAIPFVGLELDLMAGGEEDAAALGADPRRVKTLVLACVALATAAAVSVCGQIAFVGLLIPHLIRITLGPHHRVLLPLSFLAGATLLLLVLVAQHGLCPLLAEWLGAAAREQPGVAFERLASLQPGVLTSLLGAPFFIGLLLRQSKTW